MRIALAQIDPTVGDVDGNAAKVAEWIGRAAAAGAELAVFPELCLPGYPAEDLYLKRHFVAANRTAVEGLAREVGDDLTVLVGFAEPVAGGGEDRHAHNSLAVLRGGEIRAVYRKNRLPNYAVFDEQRYFVPGAEPLTVDVAATRVGLTICEDVWEPGPPAASEADGGSAADRQPVGLALPPRQGPRARGDVRRARPRIRGSRRLLQPGRRPGRARLRRPELRRRPERNGRSPAPPSSRRSCCSARSPRPAPARLAEPLPDLAEVYAALVLGLRDYVRKNGFRHVGLALSGGIDSALVALLAADAIGAGNVTCVVMPSPHSSAETQADARAIAANLGAEVLEIPIEAAMGAYEAALGESLVDLAAENIQARIRGNLMMALSNEHGWLVLTTGNKSEMSVGYATLYGDMAGGFAAIKDVPKTLVYELVRHRNEREGRELVPASAIERAPSAELRPEQLDSDSLPPYELLDRVLEAYVERDEGREEMVAAGMPAEVVDEVVRMVDRAEYKRRQAAPGIRITPKAFGRDRRLPITNRFGG